MTRSWSPLAVLTSRGSPAAYLAPLREALIDKNRGHVNIVVCESDYRALKRGIAHLLPALQQVSDTQCSPQFCCYTPADLLGDWSDGAGRHRFDFVFPGAVARMG